MYIYMKANACMHTHMYECAHTHTHAQVLSPSWNIGIRVVGTLLLPALGFLRTARTSERP